MSVDSKDGLSHLRQEGYSPLTPEQIKARLEIVNRQIDEKNISNLHDGRHETYLCYKGKK